jgi:VanZ family protein
LEVQAPPERFDADTDMKNLRRIAWGLVILYWGALFALTHTPPDRAPHPPSFLGDKGSHALAYLVLTFLLGFTLWTFGLGRRSRLWPWITLAAVLAYGAVDEWTQIIVGRDCELLDWVADGIGAAVAVLLLAVVFRIVRRVAGDEAVDGAARSEVSAVDEPAAKPLGSVP